MEAVEIIKFFIIINIKYQREGKKSATLIFENGIGPAYSKSSLASLENSKLLNRIKTQHGGFPLGRRQAMESVGGA